MGNLKIPFISIVVPYRNAKENLKDCAQSLLNQNYPKDKYEIIMVDNGSADGGDFLLKEYKDLILLKEDEVGHGAARNKGASLAKGEIIAFTDSDCVADANWLRNLANAFDSEKVAAVAGEIKAYNATTELEIFYETHMCQKRSLSFEHPYAITANFAVLKHLFEKVGSFDERFAQTEDVDFSWRLQDREYKIKYKPEVVVYHKNIKTKLQLFKKIFFQSLYAPKVIKKNLKFLERKKRLPKINAHHYKELTIDIFKFIFPKGKNTDRHKLLLNIIFLIARKLGLLCGSIRFRFFYI